MADAFTRIRHWGSHAVGMGMHGSEKSNIDMCVPRVGSITTHGLYATSESAWTNVSTQDNDGPR